MTRPICISLFTFCCFFLNIQAQNTSEIIAAEKGLIAALNQGDAQAYFSYLHPDHDIFLPESPTLITSNLEEMEKNFADGFKLDIDHVELQVKFIDKSTAIVTGYETGKSIQVDGSILEGKRKYSGIWVKIKKKWKAVHAHISASGK